MNGDATDMVDITNEQLHFRLTGDDRHCSRKCETCRRTGCVRDYSASAMALTGGSVEVPCDDCNGEGVIWNRERLAAACQSFIRDGCYINPVDPSRSIKANLQCYSWYRAVLKPADNDFAVAWDNRHGADWQAAIEAHVLGTECQCSTKQSATRTVDCEVCNGTGRIGGYVEPAPDYRNDERALKAALREGGWWCKLELHPDGCEASVGPANYDTRTMDSHAEGSTESEALFAATVAAVMGAT